MSEVDSASFSDLSTEELLYLLEVIGVKIPRRGLRENTYRSLILSKIRGYVQLGMNNNVNNVNIKKLLNRGAYKERQRIKYNAGLVYNT